MNKSLKIDDIVAFIPHESFWFYKNRAPVFRVIEASTEEKPAIKLRVITNAIRNDVWGNVHSFPLMHEFYCDPNELMKVAECQ